MMKWLRTLWEIVLGWLTRNKSLASPVQSSTPERVPAVRETPTPDPQPVEEEPMPNKPTLKKGSRGDDVKTLQTLLNAHGANAGNADGQFGSKTERALQRFATTHGLECAGVTTDALWAALEESPPKTGMEPSNPITTGSAALQRSWNNFGGLLKTLAEGLGFHPAAAVAVLMAESGGSGFGADGRLKIRFENHVFKKQLKDDELFAQHFKYDSNQRWKSHYWRSDPAGEWRRLHTRSAGQAEEWRVLDFARTLTDEGALLSISMGAPQVMGFNAKKVGHDTARSMFDEWKQGDGPQIRGLFAFIRSNNKMVTALASEDWEAFAYRYNGSGQAAHYGEVIGDYVQAAKAAGVS
jgi:hypothetical protein